MWSSGLVEKHGVMSKLCPRGYLWIMIALEGNGQRHIERRLLDLMGFKSRWRLLRYG
jgi:hypothetical protein